MCSINAERVMEELAAALAAYQELDLEVLTAEELLVVVRDAEVMHRRMDSGTDRLAGEVHRTGAHRVDGHANARCALVHLGRLSGSEAAQRISRARALRSLPCVADACRQGTVPTASVRAIARVAANPWVRPFLEGADAIFAEQAATETHGELVVFLAQCHGLSRRGGPPSRGGCGRRWRSRRRRAG